MPFAGFINNAYRLSREVDNLSEVQRKEEVNIQTYKKISTTLESVFSASAASTIAPQLSRSLVTQAECKKIMEEKEKTMQRIWTDAVEAFVRDVTHEVDVSLQVALMSIKQEARQVGYSISGRSHKRQRDESDVGQSEEREKNKKRDNSETIIREHKRRRVRDSSPSGLQDDKVNEINDMKMKIDQQAQMLALLAQENHEVRGM